VKILWAGPDAVVGTVLALEKFYDAAETQPSVFATIEKKREE
jgi:hypothetical protein